MKYPNTWDKSTSWHSYRTCLGLGVFAFIITIGIWLFSSGGDEHIPSSADVAIVERSSKYIATFNPRFQPDYDYDADYIHRMYNPSMSKSKVRHLLLYTYSLCEYYNMDYNMVKALIGVESSWNKKAVSKANAVGLMQIVPAVARDYRTPHDELYDPYVNITIGIKHLATLAGRYDDDARMVLIAYNEGPRNADKRSKRHIKNHKYANKIINAAFED